MAKVREVLTSFGRGVAKAASSGAAGISKLGDVVKWAFIATAMLAIAFSLYIATNSILGAWRTLTSPISAITGNTPIPGNLPEVVSDQRLTCRAYTMMADFEGSKLRLEDDKVRILRTIVKHSEIHKIDECEIFRRQLELVAPGWGRRTAFGFRLPDRTFGYIETEFSANERDVALLLARRLASEPDPSWVATVLIRPRRGLTLGNQKAAELKKIRETMERAEIQGPTEYEFYKPILR